MIASAPQALLDLVTASKPKTPHLKAPSAQQQVGPILKGLSPYLSAALVGEVVKVAQASEGTRNNTLNTAAVKIGRFVGSGALNGDEVMRELLRAATSTGLPEPEAMKTIVSGLTKGISEPRTPPPPAKKYPAAHVSYVHTPQDRSTISFELIVQTAGEHEQGAATLFKATFKHKCVYDHAEKQWYVYSGHSWHRDKVAQVLAFVDEVQALFKAAHREIVNKRRTLVSLIAEALVEAASAPDGSKGNTEHYRAQDDTLKAQEKLCIKAIIMLQASFHREQVVKLATQGKDSLGISGDEWDQTTGVLPCSNGVVDLKNGTLRPGKPTDYLRNAVPIDYDPSAKCPVFMLFLASVMDEDQTMVGFLKRLFGHAIGGTPTENVFAVLVGPGGNGKSILALILSHVLGELAWSVRAEFFLDSGRFGSADAPSASLLSICGKRVIFASEPAEGRAFDNAKVKHLTGSDRLTCRGPYAKHEISFTPTHVPFLLANTKPAASAGDEAFWRRTIIIEFLINFVDNPEKPNERLRDRDILNKLKAEAPGILRWLVEGHMEWQANGLQIPAKVRAATAEYRTETDTILHFVDDRCNRVEGSRESFRTLYEVYKHWASEMKLPIWTQKKFSMQLSRHFTKGYDSNKNVVFTGIVVISDHFYITQYQERHRNALNLLHEAIEVEAEAKALSCESSTLQEQGRFVLPSGGEVAG